MTDKVLNKLLLAFLLCLTFTLAYGVTTAQRDSWPIDRVEVGR